MREAYPGQDSKTPPAGREMNVSGGNRPTHVANEGDLTGVGVDRPGPHT